MEELLRQLGIEQEGHYSNKNTYTIDIEDSNEFGKIYSKLERSNRLIDRDGTATLMTEDNASVQYENEQFVLTLLADFNEDIYSLVIKRR